MTNLLDKLSNFNTYFTKGKSLGKGNYGEVFLLQDGDKQYAIKKIRLKGNAYLQSELVSIEGDLLKNKKLPNVIQTFGSFFFHDGLRCQGVCMEYFPGINIRQAFEESSINPDLLAIKMAVGIVKGLQALHREGLAHRDIKPENILYSQGKIKIIDLGFICSAKTHSYSRKIRGSPLFFSPEIAQTYFERKDGTVDLYQAGDIWALGITMYNLIYSSEFIDAYPFTGDDLYSLSQSIIQMEYSFPHRDLPKTVLIIKKCLTSSLIRPKSNDLLFYLQKEKGKEKEKKNGS